VRKLRGGPSSRANVERDEFCAVPCIRLGWSSSALTGLEPEIRQLRGGKKRKPDGGFEKRIRC